MLTIVGVMGGACTDEIAIENARAIGRLIAEKGWVLLNGGRDTGVMAASAAGASEAGGLVVGILPTRSAECVAPGVDIAIPTGMGDARNEINVLASRVVVALPGGAGTISEIALALKARRPVVTLGFPLGELFAEFARRGQLVEVATPEEAIAAVCGFLEA
ncbi:MAG: DNA-binding protein [Coriobacteriia bacterium]